MKQIQIEDLQYLSIGAAILGSGGGGCPRYEMMIASYLLHKYGLVVLKNIDELEENTLVVPIAMMGALLINKEKLLTFRSFVAIFKEIKKRFPQKNIIIMPGEIGGSNAFIAIIAAAVLKLPVLNADTIGRAFPELQMSSCNLNKISCCPVFLSDSKGNIEIIENKDSKTAEKIARKITMHMGSTACICLYLMDLKEAKSALVKSTVSRAVEIGKALKNSKKNGIEDLLKITNGQLIFKGMISDVDQRIEDGFLKGTATVCKGKKKCKICYQNENLAAFIDNEVVITTPDIITVIEAESKLPITCESLKYGQRVYIIAIPSPKIWVSKKGLNLVGPKVFGFDVDYKSISKKGVL
ncbi:MAG: DUF917 domain-containing protein [Parachlamydiales bacterium]|nr:DUF917 domain-containing protein [Parachlamydiales bacterium]